MSVPAIKPSPQKERHFPFYSIKSCELQIKQLLTLVCEHARQFKSVQCNTGGEIIEFMGVIGEEHKIVLIKTFGGEQLKHVVELQEVQKVAIELHKVQ